MHMNFILESLAEARRTLPEGNSDWREERSLLLACLLCEFGFRTIQCSMQFPGELF